MGVSFSQSQASPGDPITLTASASPNSVVLLSVFDRSLTLLAEACRSLESSNVSCVSSYIVDVSYGIRQQYDVWCV